MRVDRTERDGIPVVAFEGDFDFHDVTSASDTIGAFIDKGDHRVVFDLKRLQFISSGGLGYFIQTAKRLKSIGGELVLACPPASFGWIVQTLGIDRVIRIFPDDEAAVSYVRDGGPRPAAGS